MATPAVHGPLVHQEVVDFPKLKAVASEALLASERAALTGMPLPFELIQKYTETFNPYIMYGLLVLFEKTLKIEPNRIELVPKPIEARDASREH